MCFCVFPLRLCAPGGRNVCHFSASFSHPQRLICREGVTTRLDAVILPVVWSPGNQTCAVCPALAGLRVRAATCSQPKETTADELNTQAEFPFKWLHLSSVSYGVQMLTCRFGQKGQTHLSARGSPGKEGAAREWEQKGKVWTVPLSQRAPASPQTALGDGCLGPGLGYPG